MTNTERIRLARGTIGTLLMEIENRIQTLIGALISNDRQAGCAQNVAHDEVFRWYGRQCDEMGKCTDPEERKSKLHAILTGIDGRVSTLIEGVLDRDATKALNTAHRLVWLDLNRYESRVVNEI